MWRKREIIFCFGVWHYCIRFDAIPDAGFLIRHGLWKYTGTIIEGQIPQTSYLFDLLMNFRLLFTWCILTLFIALMYTYVPGGKYGFKMQLPGAAVAAVGWSVITFVFPFMWMSLMALVPMGSLTTIIVLMLWLYACMYLVMTGAFLNRYFKPAFQFFVGKRRKEKAV